MLSYNVSHFVAKHFFPVECSLPSSWRRYWFPPRSLANDQASPSSLSQNSTTLFLSSCTQVPSELTTWYTNNTLYPYSHKHTHTHTEYFVTPVHPCYYCTDKTMTHYCRSLTCKHSIHLIDTHKTHSSRSHELDFVYQQTLRDKTGVAKILKKTYSKKGVAYWKVNAWGCFFSIPLKYYHFGKTDIDVEVLVCAGCTSQISERAFQ